MSSIAHTDAHDAGAMRLWNVEAGCQWLPCVWGARWARRKARNNEATSRAAGGFCFWPQRPHRAPQTECLLRGLALGIPTASSRAAMQST